MNKTLTRRRTHTVTAASGLLGCAALALALTGCANPSATTSAAKATAPGRLNEVPGATAPAPSSPAVSATGSSSAASTTAPASQGANPSGGAFTTAPAKLPATSQISGWLPSSQVDPAAWLPTSDLPLNALEHWSPWYSMYAPVSSDDSGFKLTSEVCTQPSLNTLGAYAIAPRDAHDTLAATDPDHASAEPDQDIVFFPNTATAQHAYEALLADAATCERPEGAARTSPGLHLSATGQGEAAWATYPTPVVQAGFLGPLHETHLYLVQRGPAITILSVDLISGTGTPNAAYRAVSDPQVLAALGAHLSGYAVNQTS